MKISNCVECGFYTSLNSKGLCSECVFKKNHQGKSRIEVYQERSKVNIKPKKKTVSIGRKTTRYERDQRNLEILRKDIETYEKVFNLKKPFCEECGKKLCTIFRYDDFIVDRFRFSHILSKGAYPEHRHNLLNFNLLCFDCHQKWDHGDKESMKIFETNKKIIEQILNY